MALARDSRPSPGKLRAGDRAPDAPGPDATGRSKRLFDAFRGPHFTLLLFSHGTEDAPASELWGAAIRTLRVVSEPSLAQPRLVNVLVPVVNELAHDYAPLVRARPKAGATRLPRWKLAVNASI